jgi:hypothetical protein
VTPAATAAPSATVEIKPEPPAEIELTIDATPKVVEVYRGNERLGTSDKPLRLARAEGRVKLTFKAAGYAPQDLEVPASSNTTVSVRLTRAAGKGGGKKSDLEF